MSFPLRFAAVSATGLALVGFASAQPATVAASSLAPTVLHVGQIDREDIAHRPGSEPQTLVEPDVAISPINGQIAVAVAHDGRFPTGGAIDISYAWTHDGGGTWHHAPMHGLTRAAGGVWDRASDPVVAFGPNGDAYISVLVFNFGCATGIAVARSTDGGATFGAPVLVQSSKTCNYSDDKNWLAIDTQAASPHLGRLYQFWTAFLTVNGHAAGSPQVLRWSDDRGAHWSGTTIVTRPHENTQNSQALIQPDGTITDVYLGRGTSMVARTSHDGGATWSSEATVTNSIGVGPARIRCCLPSAAADPITGRMYAVWEANGPGTTDAVMLSTSSDGRVWSVAQQVSRDGRSTTIQHVNAAVAAYGGRVFVSYGTRDTAISGGRFVMQDVSTSYDGGASFGAPLQLGPPSDLKYAASAGGRFPGDYIGISATQTRVALVWCVSSQPSSPTQMTNQTLFGAVLEP
jgi:hypothetical protein